MSRWSLSPTTGATVGELKESVNQRLADLDLILAELEQVEQQVKGQSGYTAQMSGTLDMQGNRLTGLPNRPSTDSDAASWQFQKSGVFLYSESDTFATSKRIEHEPAINGAGSVTLDQLTHILTEAFASQLPAGIIVLWKGSIATIPAGWNLCDGTNGTEDLRDVFIPGAGSAYAVNATGGSNTVNLAHAHTADGTLATAAEAAHTHALSITSSAPSASQLGDVSLANINVPANAHTHDVIGTTAAGSSHSHDVTGSTDTQLSTTTENRPVYYAKAYIQKL